MEEKINKKTEHETKTEEKKADDSTSSSVKDDERPAPTYKVGKTIVSVIFFGGAILRCWYNNYCSVRLIKCYCCK